MKIFLFVIIFSNSGGSVYYEKSYEMPDMETCLRAAAGSRDYVHASAGAQKYVKAGAILYCATQEETP